MNLNPTPTPQPTTPLPSFNPTTPQPSYEPTPTLPETQQHYLELTEIEMYTDEEYNKLLVNKEWTKPTTDCLMDYVKQYGMCWEVIHDRLISFNDFKLSVDAVIERYLQIVWKLSQTRFAQKYPLQTFVHPYDFFPFDRRYEEQRKEEGMKELLANVIHEPEAKLFLPQALMVSKEIETQTDDADRSNALLDSLSQVVNSRYHLLINNTALTNLINFIDDNEKKNMNFSLFIFPDEEYVKMADEMKKIAHNIEELRARKELLMKYKE